MNKLFLLYLICHSLKLNDICQKIFNSSNYYLIKIFHILNIEKPKINDKK